MEAVRPNVIIFDPLYKALAGDENEAEDVRKALMEAKAKMSEKTPISSSAPGFSGNAETALQAAANAVQSAHPNLTPHQAYARALRQNPALYSQYLAANPAQTGGR